MWKITTTAASAAIHSFNPVLKTSYIDDHVEHRSGIALASIYSEVNLLVLCSAYFRKCTQLGLGSSQRSPEPSYTPPNLMVIVAVYGSKGNGSQDQTSKSVSPHRFAYDR